MTPTKVLVGQVLVVFAIVIATLWFATQWAASQLGYQPQLGEPWVSVASYPVYYPWRLFEWWYAFDAYAPALFNEAGTIAAAGGVAGIIVAMIGSLWRARQNRLVTTYHEGQADRPNTPSDSVNPGSYPGPLAEDAEAYGSVPSFVLIAEMCFSTGGLN